MRSPSFLTANGGCLAYFSAAVFASGTPLQAQLSRPLQTPLDFTIDQWTTEHGLPQNSVNAIVQGPDGYLWIGTYGGLARFDGTRFTLIERTDSTGRHVDRVLSLAVSPDSAIWIGTEAGLLRHKQGVYRKYDHANGLPDDEVRSLHVDRAGVVWVGTGRGLARIANGNEAGALRAVAGIDLGSVASITEDSTGTLWINTANGPLSIPRGDMHAAKWRHTATRQSAVVLLHDRTGGLWIGQSGRIRRTIRDTVREFGVPGSIMVEDPAGGYWVGTINDGAYFIREGNGDRAVDRYPLPDGRTAFRVRALHVDVDGSVWLGTNANGLLRARRNLFTTYTSAHGLSHSVATAVFADRTGTIWVATNCGGVNALDLERRIVRISNPRSPRDPTGDPCVFALGQTPDGTVWQGSYGGGVTALPQVPGQARFAVAGLPDQDVLALYTARDGTLWVGTRNGGLAAVSEAHQVGQSGGSNRRVRTTYTVADGLANNSVRVIYETRDGALWVGTADGLSRFRNGVFTSYNARDGLSATHIRSLYEDRDGTLWVGTYGGGLNRWRNGTFRSVDLNGGLADDVVSAILEDDAGNFWMSGNRGIYRVPRQQLNAFADGRIDRVDPVLYGRSDGLRNPETNGGFQPAGYKDARGHLWFPTIDGVAVVDPARVPRSTRPPAAVLEEVVVNGVARQAADVLKVGPGGSNLEFRYAGLSVSIPEHVRFQYRLEGFDDHWVEAGQRRIAYYPRLPAGTYRFSVRAANRYGVWGETSAALQLRVVPPFWKAWWFRLGILAGVAGLAAALVRLRVISARADQLAKQEFSRRLIASQEHERRRLAGELHDGLGQEMLIVKNRALLALRGESTHENAREQLQRIADVVSGSLANIRALAHNLTPHQLDHLGISTALGAMVDVVAETAAIRLDARIEYVDGLLPLESEIHLFRIVQEGLNNIVKHSQSSTAFIHVRREDSSVRVTMSDQGRGFPAGTRGFGLSGMAERARILGGSLVVRSDSGQGTQIDVSVPASADQAVTT